MRNILHRSIFSPETGIGSNAAGGPGCGLFGAGAKNRARRGFFFWALKAGGCVFAALVASADSLRAQSATGPLPPLSPPYGPVAPTFWEQHGTAMMVGGALFLAGVGALVWLVLRPRPATVIKPSELARQHLTRLRGQPESGPLLSEISQVLRRYAVAALELPAGEYTTREFAVLLAETGKLPPPQALVLANFLGECDRRKFAPASSGATLNAADRALAIVAEIEEQMGRRIVQDQTTNHA